MCSHLKDYLTRGMTFRNALGHVSKCAQCRLARALNALARSGESEFGYGVPTEAMVIRAIKIDHPGIKIPTEPKEPVHRRLTCVWCGRWFEPATNASKLCSEGCKLLQKRRRERKRVRVKK